MRRQGSDQRSRGDGLRPRRHPTNGNRKAHPPAPCGHSGASRRHGRLAQGRALDPRDRRDRDDERSDGLLRAIEHCAPLDSEIQPGDLRCGTWRSVLLLRRDDQRRAAVVVHDSRTARDGTARQRVRSAQRLVPGHCPEAWIPGQRGHHPCELPVAAHRADLCRLRPAPAAASRGRCG